jgi:hypothetical protein
MYYTDPSVLFNSNKYLLFQMVIPLERDQFSIVQGLRDDASLRPLPNIRVIESKRLESLRIFKYHRIHCGPVAYRGGLPTPVCAFLKLYDKPVL